MSAYNPATRPTSGGNGRVIGSAIGIAVIGLIGVTTFFGGYFTTGERERTVVTRGGAIQYIAGPGFHLKMPWIDGAHDIAVSRQTVKIDNAETYTKGSLPLILDIFVEYEVPDDEVEFIYRTAPDLPARLASLAMARTKDVLGTREAMRVGEERPAISQDALKLVRAEAKRLYHVEVFDLRLEDIQLSKALVASIEGTAAAEQNRLKASIEAQAAEVQARGKAQSEIQRARGEAEGRLLTARSEAEATAVKGEAEARAIRAQAEALGSNPLLVQLEQARRWDGKLPTQMLSGNPVPFLNLGTAQAQR